MVGDEVLNKHGVKPFASIDGQKLRVFYMENLNIAFVESLHSEMRQAVRKVENFAFYYIFTIVLLCCYTIQATGQCIAVARSRLNI